jgi:prevent-host-death family protein
MQIVDISEAKAQLSALVAQAMRGKEVLIGRSGTPVVKLVPYDRNSEPRQPGALRGKIRIAA